MALTGRAFPTRVRLVAPVPAAGPTIVTLPDDPGAFTDALTVTVVTPLAETGAFTDALAVSASVPVSDTGAFTDALTVTVVTPLTETGAFTDALTVSAVVPLPDAGGGTDALSVSAVVPLPDAGGGTDALSVNAYPPPTGLAAIAVSSTEIDLSWNMVTSAVGYDLQRNGVVIATNLTGLSYADTGLTPSTTYTYDVRSVF